MAKDSVTIFTLTNKEINFITNNFVNKLLHGDESRFRNQVIRALGNAHENFDADRIALNKKHAEKDNKGEPLLEEGGKRYRIKDEKKLAKEWEELSETEITLHMVPSKDAFRFARNELKDSIKRLIEESRTINAETGEKTGDPQLTFNDQEFIDTAEGIIAKLDKALKG